MKVEFVPYVDDIFRLRRSVQRRHQHGPLVALFVGTPLVVAAGAVTMALTGPPLWWTAAAVAAALSCMTLVGVRNLSITREQVEKEFVARPWMREPFRLEADEAGITYEHGPYRARAAWEAFAGLRETDDHLVLEEKRGPAALMYGLPKRELDQAGGSAVWRTFLSTHIENR